MRHLITGRARGLRKRMRIAKGYGSAQPPVPLAKAFNPSQPRAPKGSPDGGKWTGDSSSDPVAEAYRFDTSTEGFGINRRIRQAVAGGNPLSAEEADYMARLDVLIDNEATPAPASVYRTIAGPLGRRLTQATEAGRPLGIIADSAFLSTSLDSTVALEIAVSERNNHPVVLNIQTGRRKGLIMNKDEVLFGRGTVLEIKSAAVQAIIGPMSDEEVEALVVQAVLKTPGRASVPIRKAYDPNQPRDPGGEDGGKWVASGATGGAETTKDELNAILDYTSEYSEDLNAALRQDEGLDDEMQKMTDDLNSFIAKDVLAESATLYRGISANGVKHLQKQGIAIGDVIEDLGFTSTSRDLSIAGNFRPVYADGMILRIDYKPTKGIVARDIEATGKGFFGENEVLFRSGTSMRVTGWDPLARILDVEPVPDSKED